MSCGQCRRFPCECGFTRVTEEMGQTLVSELTPLVDCVRDLETQLGARQYRVTLVWTRWTDGERNEGQELVAKEIDILPTPLVSDMSALARQLEWAGINEAGSVRISEISARYDEDLLMGRGGVVQSGEQIPLDCSFYWEIVFPRPDGVPAVRRRFTPKTAPNKNPTGFEWTIDLVKASADRERQGEPA